MHIPDSIQKMVNSMIKAYNDESPLLKNLAFLKVMLIFILILATCIYQYEYIYVFDKENPTLHGLNNTFINNPSTAWRVVMDSAASGLLAVLLVVGIKISRHGITSDLVALGSAVSYSIVFGIIALFVFAEEASGFNRWLAPEGTYNSINTNDPEAVKTENAAGHPFLRTTAYTSFIIVGLIIVGIVLNMCRLTYHGYTTHKFTVSLWRFGLECLFMCLVGGATPVVSTLIRKDPLETSALIMIAAFAIISVGLHVMFEYTGLY